MFSFRKVKNDQEQNAAGEVFKTLAQTLNQLSDSIGNQNLTQRNISIQIEHLSSSVSTQGVTQVITPFEGDPKGFKEWIKAVENILC